MNTFAGFPKVFNGSTVWSVETKKYNNFSSFLEFCMFITTHCIMVDLIQLSGYKSSIIFGADENYL